MPKRFHLEVLDGAKLVPKLPRSPFLLLMGSIIHRREDAIIYVGDVMSPSRSCLSNYLVVIVNGLNYNNISTGSQNIAGEVV